LRAAHARPPPDGRTFSCVAGGLLVALAVRFLNWQRFRAAICSVLWMWVCDLHAMKAGLAGRHPKVPLGGGIFRSVMGHGSAVRLRASLRLREMPEEGERWPVAGGCGGRVWVLLAATRRIAGGPERPGF
jgi:hypothetical protein